MWVGAKTVTKKKDSKGSSLFKLLKRTIYRYKQGSETRRSLILRIFFLPKKYLIRRKNVLDESWDYLIILDACRYDMFKEVNTIPGELSLIHSQGTHTVEWLKNTFAGRNLDDLVYVSGSPQISPLKLKEWIGNANPFFLLRNVWDKGWDTDLGTVNPGTVKEAVLNLQKRYPNKRMIIHFLQPHAPFIGKARYDMNDQELRIFNTTDWTPLLTSKDTLARIWEAYKSNLSFVLEHVLDLIRNLDEGEVVITSDHGEMFGKYGVYGHMPAFYSGDLLKVPWLKVDREKI